MTALGATVDAVDVGSAELVFESSPQHEVIVSTKRTLTLRRRWYHSTFGFCLERTHSLNCGWELSSHSHLLDTPHLGIRVLTVETDGPASLAGVQPQDVITHVNDTAVRTLSTIEAFHHVRDDGDILMLCVGRTERFDPSDLHTTFTAPSDLESHTLDLELPQTEGGQGTPFHLVPHIEIGAEGQPWTMQALVSSVGDRQCDVRSGDLISGVDGVDVETMSLEQLQTTINDRCATGPLKLRVVRYGAEPLATSQFHVSIHKSEEEPLGFRLASTFRSDSRADRLAASQSGLRVLSMTQGGPADIAGIRVDDVVTEISGVTVRELATEEEAFQRMRASGSVLDLAVYRVTELKEAETELPPHFTPPVTADRPLAIQVTRHDSSHVLPFTIVPHVEAPLAAGATRMLPVILVTENWKCRLRTGDTVLSLSTLTGTPLDVTGMNLRQVQDWMEREWCVNDGVRLNVLRFHSGPRGQPVSDEIKPEYSTLFLLGILALVIFSLAISAYCLFGVALVDVPLALHPKLPPVVSLLSLSNASLISSKVQAFAVGKIVYHFGWLPTNDIRNATAKELYSELNPHNPLALPPPYLHLSKLVLDIHGNGATCELNATAFDQCLTCNIPWPSDTMEGQFCEGHVLSRILGALSCHLVAGVVFCIGLYQKWRGKQPFHNDKFLQSGWVLGWNFCGLTAVVMFAMLYVWGAIPDTTRSALFPTGGESHGDLYSTPGYCTMLPFMMLIAFWLTTHYLKLLWFRAPTTSDYESDPLLPSYTPFADEEDDQDQDDHRLEVYSPPGLHHGVTPQPSLPGPSSIEMTQIGSRDMR